MSGELHEISEAIGGLRADVARGHERSIIFHQKMDALVAQVSNLAASMAAHVAVDEAVAIEVRRLRVDAEEAKKFQYKALGGFTVAAAVFGAVGAKAAAWISTGATALFR